MRKPCPVENNRRPPAKCWRKRAILRDKKIMNERFMVTNRFKAIRNYYGLSQSQFAQKIHMSPGFVCNVEAGRTNVSQRTIDAVCGAFPIDRNWLMTGENSVTGKDVMFTESVEHNPVDKAEIAFRVKTVRKYVDLTQEEFGKRIGYSKIQVHSVEKGKVIPSNQFLEKIVEEFGVNAQWMFTGSGNMENQERGSDHADDHVQVNDSEQVNGHAQENVSEQANGLDEQLIGWLNDHSDVVAELRKRSGLD